MADAIGRMVDFLLHNPEPWKPDRWAALREKKCVRCYKRKPLEKFAFAANVCKVCKEELLKKRRKSRHA